MADSIVRQALADLRGALACAATALETLEGSHLIPTEAALVPDQNQEAAFAAHQLRLAVMDRWPTVQITPWICTDEVNTATFGQRLGDDYRAGTAELSFEPVPDAAPWLTLAAVGGAGINLGMLLEGLPGLLALLADEQVSALLARDGWTIPPVLVPLLAQIDQMGPTD